MQQWSECSMFSKKPCILEHEEEVWISKDRHVILSLYFQESEKHTALEKI